MKWYNQLVEYDDEYIYEYARTVKDISDKMEFVGDNRLAYTLNCKIFADLFSGGYPKIKELLQDNHYLAQGFEQLTYFVDGLIGFLKKAQLKESELLSIWAIGMRLLDWRSEDIKMQRNWLTAAGHFRKPETQQECDYCHLINWNKADNIETLFYQILKILILSEDADAAYIALTGLFALLRSDTKCLENIEDDWEEYHYRAKEWLMMLYELLWYLDDGSRSSLYEIVKRHCKDDDFNVALYANIMLVARSI